MFEKLATAIGSLPNALTRSAAAVDVFGKSGRKLLPMIEDMKSLRAEAIKLGRLTTDDAKKADAFGDKLSAVGLAIKLVVFRVGAELAPTLGRLADQIIGAATATGEWLRENKGLVLVIASVGAGLTAAGLSLMVLSPAVTAAGTAFGFLAAAITSVGAAISFTMTPIGAIVAAVGGLATSFLLFTDAGGKALDAIKSKMGQFAQVATSAWKGISAALAAGDLQAAGEMVWQAVRLGGVLAVEALKEQWSIFSGWFKTTFAAQIETVARLFAAIRNVDEPGFNALSDSIKTVAGWLANLSSGARTFIGNASIAAVEVLALAGGFKLLIGVAGFVLSPLLSVGKALTGLGLAGGPVVAGLGAVAVALTMAANQAAATQQKMESLLDTMAKFQKDVSKQTFMADPVVKQILAMKDKDKQLEHAGEFIKQAALQYQEAKEAFAKATGESAEPGIAGGVAAVGKKVLTGIRPGRVAAEELAMEQAAKRLAIARRLEDEIHGLKSFDKKPEPIQEVIDPVKQAIAEFQKAMDEMANRFKRQEHPADLPRGEALGPILPRIPDGDELRKRLSSVGTFSSSALFGLGAGGERAVEETAKNTAEMRQELHKVRQAILNIGIRFA